MFLLYVLAAEGLATPELDRSPVPAPPAVGARTAPKLPWPPNPKHDPKSAYPTENPAGWITKDDYPPGASLNDLGGNVGFRLTIDPLGQVSGCVVTQSSGTPELDDATCSLLRIRARFEPATDQQGKAVAGTYANRIRWIMPIDRVRFTVPRIVPLPKPTLLVRSMVVEKDGSLSNCKIERAEGVAAEAVRLGSYDCPDEKLDRPFVDAQGRAVRKTVRFTEGVAYQDVPVSGKSPRR